MGNPTATIIVNCEPEAASSIASEIDGSTDGRSIVSERKNIDGSVADLALVFGSLAINALPHVLTFIAKIVELRTVRSIKVVSPNGDEIELTNPRATDVEELKRHYPARAQDGSES